MAIVKAAASADREKAAALLERIRSENPSHWPYGLYPEQFDPGDLFLIRKEAGADPLGFVGWQERDMGGERVGLYSIGVLPEWRGQGVAKTAVARLIQEKAAGVDRVAALVVEGNTPSEKLAEALGVPRLALQKRANPLVDGLKFIGRGFGGTASKGEIAGRYASMVGLPLASDVLSYGRDPSVAYGDQPMYAGRAVNALLNAAIGRWAMGAQGTERFGRMLSAPVKDLTLAATGAIPSFAAAANRYVENSGKALPAPSPAPAAQIQAPEAGASGMPPWALLGGAGLLTAGVGGAAYILQKAIRDKAEAPVNIQTSQGGRLKVTLPTTREGDSETVLDLPFDQENALSNSLRNRLKLDTRRRLYAETKARVKHRGVTQHLPFQVS